MSWAKLDDRANEHRKQLAAGAEACWLWACGLMYANRQDERDGFIPELALGMLYPLKNVKRLADRLVKAGLWERTEGGYQIHNYGKWNPSADQIEAERAAGRARAAKSYEARKAKNQNSSGEENPKTSTEDEPKKQDSSGSTPTPTPTPGEDPPTPLRDRTPDPKSLRGLGFGSQHRADVLEVRDEWMRVFRVKTHKFRDPVDAEADAVAGAIDAYGVEKCLLVLRHAPNDGMVSGRDDDKRAKHESLGYIFGNNAAFVRILRDGEERERAASEGSPTSKIEALKKQGAA